MGKLQLLSCVNSTIADVAIKEKVSYELVRGVVDRNIDTSIDWESIKTWDVLGIDEVSLKGSALINRIQEISDAKS